MAGRKYCSNDYLLVLHVEALFISLSKHPSPSNAIKANSILRKMELSVDEGGFDANPNTMSYALAILTCGRCSDSALGARYAEALLEQMEKRALSEANLRSTVSRIAPAFVSLEAESFNVVLTAISQSRQRDAPERAMKIVQRMEQYFEMGNESVRPTTRSWNGAYTNHREYIYLLQYD